MTTVPPQSYNFCTLFDKGYASRGLALYRSLERECKKDFTLTILCLDEEVHRAFSRLALPRVRLWRPEDLGDAELLAVRKTRPHREFCWTCTGSLMLAMLRDLPEGAICTHLDADLAFFHDLAPVYEELGEKDIFIHKHDFAARYQGYEKLSGVFNVGLVAVRNSPEGVKCLQRWRGQTLEKCVLEPENGYCGDQMYLDEWPSLYSSLVVSQNPGVGVAPWNVDNHRFTKSGDMLLADGKPVIFYHYHALRTVVAGRRPKWIAVASQNYRLEPVHLKLIYKPYVRMLRLAQRELDTVALETPLFPVTFRQFLHLFRIRQLVTG